MSADPSAAWLTTGMMPAVAAPPPPPRFPTAAPPADGVPFPREAGYKVSCSDTVGCLAAALATLTGQHGLLVQTLLGPNPTAADAARVVELWSGGDLTLAHIDATGTEPYRKMPGKALVVFRARVGRRQRTESGQFAPAPVHLAVVHGADGDLYHDPHPEPIADVESDEPRLGYLHVISALTAPLAATLPLPGDIR